MLCRVALDTNILQFGESFVTCCPSDELWNSVTVSFDASPSPPPSVSVEMSPHCSVVQFHFLRVAVGSLSNIDSSSWCYEFGFGVKKIL